MAKKEKSTKSEDKNAAPVGGKMAALLEQETYQPRKLVKGEVIEGTVVAKFPDQILIDVGAKAEGLITGKEMDAEKQMASQIKVGDKIPVYVIQTEGEGGQAILSLKKAGGERKWKVASDAIESGKPVEVVGIESNRGGLIVEFDNLRGESNRGGLIVEFDNLRGFVPASHLISSPRDCIGKKLKVVVIEADKRLNRLVFSEKEAATPAELKEKLSLPFKEGETLEGSVSRVLPFGIVVSLPEENEGMVHISEISWEKVYDISSMFKIGDNVKVKVASIEPTTGKVNLSLKQLKEDPWKKLEEKYQVGASIKRPVSRITKYGIFLQLEPAIEGLVHSSKIPYGKEFKEGEELQATVDIFDPVERKVALRLAEQKEEKSTKKKVKK